MATYELVWQHVPRAPADRVFESGVIVIFADRGGVGAQVGQMLEARGATVRLVFAATAAGANAAGTLQADPRQPDAFRRVFNQTVADDGPCTGALFLWSLDDQDDEASTVSAAGQRACLSLVHLTRALVAGGSVRPRLVIATRGAQPVGGTEPPVAMAQSPVWGIGRVIALEQPDLAARLIDLAPGEPDAEARMLLEEMLQGGDEDQVAVRQGERYAPRLTTVIEPASAAATLSADAIYLITGGLGALGLRLARWAVSRGARHLALVGRSGLPDRAVWNALPRQTSQWSQVSAVMELEAQGAAIRIVRADVSDADAMRAVLDDLRAGPYPLRGVVHAAGVSSAKAIVELDAAAIDEVFRPKVAGAWNLHQLTATLDLDFFVMFSSIASVWGSRSLGHYAAANHFLDGLAHHRRASGLAALSINWGPWGGGGMATAEAQHVLAGIGVTTLDPDAAIARLEA